MVPGTASVELISVATGEMLSLRGMSDFSLGEDTEAGLSGGYVTITATGVWSILSTVGNP